MLPTKLDLPLTGLDFLQYYAPHNVYHPGVDFNSGYGNSDCNALVHAAKDGQVEYTNLSIHAGRGLGYFVIIKHADGKYTRYAHLNSVMVPIGAKVKEGDKIGTVGNTGTSYCHLHFEVFNEKLAQLQREHSYKWAYYPSGRSKDWILQYYLNPWEWLKATPEIPVWGKEVAELAKSTGIIVDWSNPYHIVGDERLEFILEKMGLLDPTKHEGHVTLTRAAIALNKAKPFGQATP